MFSAPNSTVGRDPLLPASSVKKGRRGALVAEKDVGIGGHCGLCVLGDRRWSELKQHAPVKINILTASFANPQFCCLKIQNIQDSPEMSSRLCDAKLHAWEAQMWRLETVTSAGNCSWETHLRLLADVFFFELLSSFKAN